MTTAHATYRPQFGDTPCPGRAAMAARLRGERKEEGR